MGQKEKLIERLRAKPKTFTSLTTPKACCDTLAIPDPTKAVPADRELVLRREIIPQF